MSEYSNYIEARTFVAGALDGTEKMAGSKGGNSMGWTTQQIANYAATASFVDDETPSGDIDDVNDTFTLAYTPLTGSVKVCLNGLRLKVTTDYTITGSMITFITPPTTGDTIIVDYRK